MKIHESYIHSLPRLRRYTVRASFNTRTHRASSRPRVVDDDDPFFLLSSFFSYFDRSLQQASARAAATNGFFIQLVKSFYIKPMLTRECIGASSSLRRALRHFLIFHLSCVAGQASFLSPALYSLVFTSSSQIAAQRLPHARARRLRSPPPARARLIRIRMKYDARCGGRRNPVSG